MTTINPIFQPFIEAHRYKVAKGGRGSGKSWAIARLLVEAARRQPVRILCARELQNSISDSVIRLLEDTIEREGYAAEFEIQRTMIRHMGTGAEFIFYGIKNNPTKIKSLEGVDVCWVEEAEAVTKDSWDILIPTIRKPNSEIWVSYNPKNWLDDTHQRFAVNTPDDCVLLTVNYSDNPHFPDVLRREMEECKERDFELYRHIWEGEPVADSALAIIKPKWIEAAMDAHLDPRFKAHTGNLYGGLDVADEGADLNAVCYRDGQVVTHIREWNDTDPVAVGERCYHEAAGLNAGVIRYDNIGVGAGVKGKVRELDAKYFREGKKPVRFQAFTASESPANPKQNYQPNRTNEAHFLNRKAQAWQLLADRFENTYRLLKEGKSVEMGKLISIETMSLDKKLLLKLQGELSAPRREFSNGKMKVESKDSLKKRGIPSPNLADALVMAFFDEDDALARLMKMG